MADRARDEEPPTRSVAYARRLEHDGGKWWKRWLDVQAPYRRNLRRLEPGFVLDIGCGLGRNLAHLEGNGVGIDHNRACLDIARARGLTVYSPEEFAASPDARFERYDSLLASHVLEHLPAADAADLLATYLPYVKPTGRVIVITPQEAGQRSDSTHVTYFEPTLTRSVLAGLGWRVRREQSFPFPRVAGRVFRHNEFVVVAERDAAA
jgi:2-polyprenyl-3-methyl-5-hydroxy-6-metoxy-1,4-benzoquinol methylase